MILNDQTLQSFWTSRKAALCEGMRPLDCHLLTHNDGHNTSSLTASLSHQYDSHRHERQHKKKKKKKKNITPVSLVSLTSFKQNGRASMLTPMIELLRLMTKGHDGSGVVISDASTRLLSQRRAQSSSHKSTIITERPD